MGVPSDQVDRIPRRIQDRLGELDREVQSIIARAQGKFTVQIPCRVAFDMRCAPGTGDVMTDEERAQSVGFVTRYEHLPDDVKVQLVERGGQWHIGNLWVLRHVLNDFRPLIQNQRDAVYYANVHRVWHCMLQRTDPTEGLMVRVLDEHDQDVTPAYSKWLSENRRAITAVIKGLEFAYLYNGILQHSDAELSKRFFSDYVSGELNYLLWKHVRAVGCIKGLLKPYYTMMRVLTFPALGAL